MSTKERIVIEKMFMIADKKGRDVDFLLNSEQSRVDSNMSGRDIIPKARQMGVSSLFLARYTVKCLSQRNTRAVVISHDKESTQRMLQKVHYYLDNIKGPKAVIKNASKNELTFPKTNSMFYIGTAGARKFGRGDTITNLHCSEVAFWPDAKSLMAGLFQAVPRSGEIGVESTGNGVGNWFHRQCVRAAEGKAGAHKSKWRPHFLSWLKFAEYDLDTTPEERIEIMETLDEEIKEPELVKMFNLTPGQILFRREKLEELDYDLRLFRQEYPMTLDECFQSTGFSFFTKVNYQPHDDWIRLDQYYWCMEEDHKHRRSQYAIGVDVGGGVRRDRSTIQVIDLIAWRQVAEWVGDNIPPDILAERVKEIGEHWRDAYVTVESNNHGAVTLLKLLENYPMHLIYADKHDSDNIINYGFRTSTRSRPIMLGHLRKELAGDFIIRSPLLRDELSTFYEQESGKLEAEKGCFDDRVMGLGVGVFGAQRAGYMIQKEAWQNVSLNFVDPQSLEGMIQSIRGLKTGQQGDFPVPRQDIGAPD